MSMSSFRHSTLIITVKVEALKVIKSATAWGVTGAMLAGIPLVVSAMMIAIAHNNPVILAKAGAAATHDGNGFFLVATQITAAAEILGFGLCSMDPYHSSAIGYRDASDRRGIPLWIPYRSAHPAVPRARSVHTPRNPRYCVGFCVHSFPYRWQRHCPCADYSRPAWRLIGCQ